ncbi:MAG: RNA methyltransferase [Candidatus Marinimicrobia bacterium]|nr:RNA methyltransferase [Candidatus Neomarinimicrobiota bacterium]
MEGTRLCQEGLNSNLTITACITEKDFHKVDIPSGVPQYEATRLQMEQISDSKNPQGIICIARIPEPVSFPAPEIGGVVLALDRLADPGNMGTIFRSALWFGVKHILLGPGCVDPFSPKVVRSSMGAIATLDIQSSDDLVQSLQDWTLAGGDAAVLHMVGEDLRSFRPEHGLMLVVGSEAHGVDPELLVSSKPVSIKRAGAGESLNAAMSASIALYELKGR